MKKGQAAVEFLMTYGWALLIILVAIGALAAFGVLSPSKYLQDKCSFSNNFICVDYMLNTTDAIVILVNGLGQTVYNPYAELAETGDPCTISAGDWSTDTKKTVICDVSSLNFIQNDKSKVKITLKYQKYTDGFNQTSNGELYTLVQ